MKTRREQIVLALAEVLTTTDYETATLDDVAARLKCSKAVIYYQFRSKEELFLEMSSTAMQIAFERLCDIVASHSSVAQQLNEAIVDLVRLGFEPLHAATLRCGAPSSLSSESKATLGSLARRYRAKLMEIVARGIEEGCLAPRDVRLITNTIINASQSIFRWVKTPGGIPSEVFIEEVPAMVLGGVFARPRAAVGDGS